MTVEIHQSRTSRTSQLIHPCRGKHQCRWKSQSQLNPWRTRIAYKVGKADERHGAQCFVLEGMSPAKFDSKVKICKYGISCTDSRVERRPEGHFIDRVDPAASSFHHPWLSRRFQLLPFMPCSTHVSGRLQTAMLRQAQSTSIWPHDPAILTYRRHFKMETPRIRLALDS